MTTPVAKPLEIVGEILLPERKLWDASYGVALANTARGQRADRPRIESLDDFFTWSEYVGLAPPVRTVEPQDRELVGGSQLDELDHLDPVEELACQRRDLIPPLSDAHQVDRAVRKLLHVVRRASAGVAVIFPL